MTTRTLTYLFTGRDTSLSSTAAKSGRNVENAFQRMTRSADDLLVKYGKMAAIGGAIFGAQLLKNTVQYAANLEQARAGFTTMLGSAQKAGAFLNKLQKFAASTPFNFPDLVKSSQQMLAFGFRAKDVIPNLTAIGDAAAGLGVGADGVSRITLAIGQMQAKTRVQSDEILQLTENGVPALRILANQYHVTTAEMQQMITKGVVQSSKAIPLLLEGIEKGTRGAAGATTKFGGLMAQQSHTLTGLWSNFVDTANAKLANLIQPALPYIKRGLDYITQAISGQGPAGTAIKNFARTVKPIIVDTFSYFITGAETIGKAFSALPGPLKIATVAIIGLGVAMRVAAAANPWILLASAIVFAVGAIVKNWKSIEAVFDVVRTHVLAVWHNVTGTLIRAFDDVRNFAVGVWHAIENNFFGSVLIAAVKIWWAATKLTFQLAWDFISGIFDLIAAIGKKTWSLIVGFWRIEWSILRPLFQLMGIIIGGIFVAIYKTAQTAWNIIGNSFRFMWNTILHPAINVFWTVISNTFSAILHAAAFAFGWIPGLGPKLKDAARQFDGFKNSVNNSLNGINNKTVHVGVAMTSSTNPYPGGISGRAATGGMMRGPGTGTSDSILARVSNGEYIVRASAVRRYGAGFLNAINTERYASGGGVGISVDTPSPSQVNASITNAIVKLVRSSWMSVPAIVGAGGGAGVARWAGVIAQALSLLGQSLSWLPTVERRMNQESGGNPVIVNTWDSNWLAGHPSVGLMQVIAGTFASYAGPFRGVGPFLYGVSVNPLANTYSGLNYALHNYGSLAALNRPGGYRFGGPVSFDNGGFLPPRSATLAINGTNSFEPVGRGGRTYIINVSPTPLAHPRDIGREVVSAILAFEKGSGRGWRS